MANSGISIRKLNNLALQDKIKKKECKEGKKY
jgi:hypothetical protein